MPPPHQQDALPRTLTYTPLQAIAYTYMGLERFGYEWMDHRDQIIKLYDILTQKQSELLAVATEAPQLAINICGNVTATVISPAVFRDYYLPRYNEIADTLHAAGKLVGVHFDGITLPYAQAIRESRLDYIEALTPPPTCDITVARAHQLWPDKTLWINFPSTTHLDSPERIRQTTRTILAQAKPHQRFLLGITEDVPPDRWALSFRAILDEINQHPL